MNGPSPSPPPTDDADAPGPPDELTEHTFVLFSVDTHGYALPVENVRAVLAYPQVTRVPTQAPHILGVFAHRGTIVPLWDLHILFAADGPPPERPSVLVVEHENDLFGLVVQQIDEVISTENIEVVAATEVVLPVHVSSAIKGWLRAADTGDDADEAPEGRDLEDPGSTRWRGLTDWVDDGAGGRFPTAPAPAAQREGTELHATLATSSKDERASALLALLAPVHLLDAGRLAKIGRGGSPGKQSGRVR